MYFPQVFLFFSVCICAYVVGSNNVFSQNSSLLPLVTLGNKTYYFGVYFKAPYYQALLFCQQIKMRLVSINSEDENSRLFVHIRDNSLGDGFWSSATKAIDGKNWVWLPTGEKIEYFNWEDGQPDKKGELCIELENNAYGLLWNDYFCTDEFYFICENIDNPTPAPSKNENVPEINIRKRPENSNIPETSVNGRKYRVSKFTATAFNASLTCKDFGMELVSIPDQEKSDIVTKLILQFEDDSSLNPDILRYYWTSGKKLWDGTWVWGNGQHFNYTNWYGPEPNNVVPPEDCLHIYPDGQWNDIRCEREFYFICENSEIPKTDAKCTCNSQPTVNVYVNSNPNTDATSCNEASQVNVITT